MDLLRTGCSRRSETVAGRAVGLGRAEGENGCRPDFVDVPGRRSGARRAIWAVEGAVTEGRLPSLRSVRLDDAPEHGVIGHLFRGAFHDQVELVCGDGQDAVRVPSEVPGFPRAGA